MTDRKFTPGPWHIKGERGIRGANAECVASTYCDAPVANAHLIAAAPDLYDLVELVHGSFGGGRVITFSDKDIAQFSAALAKARGEA